MSYQLRNAKQEDLLRIQEIYAYARDFMKKTGNPNQWRNNHPPLETLKKDIERRLLFVLENETGIHGVFYFYIGEDPTYHFIENGTWRSDAPYGTIHRIAGDGSGGILKAAVSYARLQLPHIRIDTHHDNVVMQNALKKLGFSKRGIIYLENGDPRIAYDFLAEE